mgnify:CR=1 FL=1
MDFLKDVSSLSEALLAVAVVAVALLVAKPLKAMMTGADAGENVQRKMLDAIGSLKVAVEKQTLQFEKNNALFSETIKGLGTMSGTLDRQLETLKDIRDHQQVLANEVTMQGRLMAQSKRE